MSERLGLDRSASLITAIIGPPFAWQTVPGGTVILEDARPEGGSQGSECLVADFAMARYPVTNAQYQRFIDDPGGFHDPQWWEFSPQARQWRVDHPHPKATAFPGEDLPRTRVSWFDSMAYTFWLDAKCRLEEVQPAAAVIRLPTEQEWQRAAVGDTGWVYPWGNEIDPSRATYGSHTGQTAPVDRCREGISPYGVMDMVGNVWEWCWNAWSVEASDLSGYSYRAMRGGAWNVSRPEYLRAAGRNGHPPRGQLNDAGFRIAVGGWPG